jgi:hypothetical protein
MVAISSHTTKDWSHCLPYLCNIGVMDCELLVTSMISLLPWLRPPSPSDYLHVRSSHHQGLCCVLDDCSGNA